jgi:hypothetical protein
MPNRIIKESICTSENINNLSPGAEILFYRLIVKADDFGCYYGNSKIIKGTCYPLKSDVIKDKQMLEWVNELIKANLIFAYIADDGKQYIKLTKWEKHQQKRANKPKYPLPKSSDINCNQVNANVPENENVFENEKRETRNENTDTHTQDSHSGKVQFAENVSMTNAEYEKLVSTYGEANTTRMVEKLDNYKGANGKKYKSDYRAILNWVADEITKSKPQMTTAERRQAEIKEALRKADEQLAKEGIVFDE